jgi:DNA-binding transcriptional MerR regulator
MWRHWPGCPRGRCATTKSGVFRPTGHTSGGERRYGPHDVARLQRIIELRDGLGMNLDEVKAFAASESRLAEIGAAYRAAQDGQDPALQEHPLQEGIAIRSGLVERIQNKLTQLQGLHDDLTGSIARSQGLLRELRGAARA